VQIRVPFSAFWPVNLQDPPLDPFLVHTLTIRFKPEKLVSTAGYGLPHTQVSVAKFGDPHTQVSVAKFGDIIMTNQILFAET
jgi:hypothetical protein